MSECSTESCTTKVRARGMCKKHYESWLSKATPDQKMRRASYPDETTLLSWAEEAHSITELAFRVGVDRKSFESYLEHRPELRELVRARALPKKLDPEVAKANDDAAKERWKKANPDKVREYNRRWGRNQSSEDRHRWNSYNRRRRRGLMAEPQDALSKEFVGIVQQDPCSYCNGVGGEADHIVALAVGGTDTWDNYTGACRSDNASKGTTPLLQFMLRKALEEDRINER